MIPWLNSALFFCLICPLDKTAMYKLLQPRCLRKLFFSVRRMTILLQWTYYILLHRTRMLLAELMFAMYGNANYEPDGDIILESTQIIPQTDEDCLDLVFDEPSWIAQKHRKIGII
ncbi:hypothetical protein AVEN_81810-1 [Araneus ventricosus]|uniref:Uncharacterized protein n=1 Tax=Araneus ventricosus TaxID=182803 RepID=A0A4Y2B236_ARAVE|nr:hypothetical protein AVEN_81810-1 [Araneus ventricosus]